MSRTTTALVVPQLDGNFVLREVYLDNVRPDEVLVEIHASGICHSDLSCSVGKLPCAPNAVLGHEGAGVVLETGSEVTTVSKGDKVLLSFSHCETCAECQSGHPAYCHTFNDRNFGGRRPDGSCAMLSGKDGNPLYSSFFGQSSFSRQTLVHRSSVVKVPADTNLELFASLGCGIQTGAGAVLNSLNVRSGSTLAVFGVGSVGMAAVMAGKIRGASKIIAIDLQPGRLELAKQLGATHGVTGSDGDVVDQIRSICQTNGVDFAVDCTGVPQVIRTMIDALGSRGRASTVGAPGPGNNVSVDGKILSSQHSLLRDSLTVWPVMNHLTFGKEYVGCSEGDSLPSQVSSLRIRLGLWAE
ncbi:chaperonin 10-like protein [Coniochaeta sp. 2T2.1]|nr:chaperonin 10-like protein [Coniochaeta sp. 2T2.1]